MSKQDEGFVLAEHIAAMADDDYLGGHPEWYEIVEEARRLLGITNTGDYFHDYP